MSNQTITAIIGAVWQRNHVVEQITALLNQTVRPQAVWVCQHGTHVDLGPALSECRDLAAVAHVDVKFIHSEVNFKYFGPLMLPMFCETAYVFMLDDDVVIGPQWLDHCREACQRYNSIIGSAGRILRRDKYRPDLLRDDNQLQRLVGDGAVIYTRHTFCPADIEFDYLVNSKFFRTDWVQHAWAATPFTLDNGNDIHLSAACKVRAGVRTYVIRQTSRDDTGNLKPQYGWDRSATFLSRPQFSEERMRIMHRWIGERIWRPVEWDPPALASPALASPELVAAVAGQYK